MNKPRSVNRGIKWAATQVRVRERRFKNVSTVGNYLSSDVSEDGCIISWRCNKSKCYGVAGMSS